MFSYLSLDQIVLLFLGSILVLLAIIIFLFSRREILTLIALFSGIIVLGFFMASLDPFLNSWDEQYHALVSKNLLTNPLKPVLYQTPLLPYNYQNWTYNHIWLHKQPLFLWQISASIKLFGVSTLSVRIPSIIMHAISAIMIYRIGKITSTERVGFIAALLFGVAYYFLELVSGKFPTEHNDTAFLFYVIASFWAWFEYQKTQRKFWLILIGLFSGGAILCKWLVGLLIYACWGLGNLYQIWKDGYNQKQISGFIFSLLITVFTVLPWQLYIHYHYPIEAKYENQLNTQHFFTVIENHSGDAWFHIDAIEKIYGYGDLIPFIILLGLMLYVYRLKNIQFRIVCISAILIIYIFFTLAATKITSFTIIVSPFFFLGLATLLDAFMQLTTFRYKVLTITIHTSLLAVSCLLMFNYHQIIINHEFEKEVQYSERKIKITELEQFHRISEQLTEPKSVVFYLRTSFQCHIAFMFYYDFIAYDYLPNSEEINQLVAQNFHLVVIDGPDIPDYIYESPHITVIQL
jgi:4-amino-4-deoxy-L-arabinose transferase-like glycosyltransferase